MFDDLQKILASVDVKTLRDDMQKMKEHTENIRASAEAGAGMVKITLDGTYKCIELELADELLKEEKNVISELIAHAITQASINIRKIVQESAATSFQDAMANSMHKK